MKTRLEKDAIGNIAIAKEAYYGSFTARALKNFQISGLKAPYEFKKALGMIKKAAAKTNIQLKEIKKDYGNAIIQASDEFLQGKFDSEFILDVFQAGAGTPFNMNINEILANRANELLGYKKGNYDPITPNNHVNLAQSSNDVIPTAIRIAALFKVKKLFTEAKKLSQTFFKKRNEFKNILKIGRTHLQDAVPVTFGQVFNAYSQALSKTCNYLNTSFDYLNEIGIGATAIGTGITSHPQYRLLMVKNLRQISKLKLTATTNPIELTQNMNAFSIASNSLRVLANDLIRISNDLKILASGPHGGIGEIILPEVEPGSSIMPGKVNPSIAECVHMVGLQIIGNDQTINLAVQAGQLELNVMTPLIMQNLLSSLELLTNACFMFRTQCIEDIKIDKERCEELLKKSLCFATGLSPYLGYKKTADLVKNALYNKKNLKEEIIKKQLISEKNLTKILNTKRLTKPSFIKKNIVRKT